MPELTSKLITEKYGEVQTKFKDGKLVEIIPSDARLDPEIKELLDYLVSAREALNFLK